MPTRKQKLGIIGSLVVAGGVFVTGLELNRPECDYLFVYEQEEICISEKVKQIIESEIRLTKGFGGVRFGQ